MFLLPSTQIYTVHIDPSKTNPLEKAVFVREGFNLFAFIFGVFWALYHRMWLIAIALAIVVVSFGLAEEAKALDMVSLTILQIAFNIFVGLQGNDLRRWWLSKRGYIMSDVVVSDNELRAQQRYFDRILAA
jgi:bacteriorhodopsin